MQFPKHFPLNSVDIVNKPPLHFLQIQDALQILSGFTWTVAYVLYVKQSNKDRSYGMPIIALCANIGWELLYSVFYPLSTTERLAYAPWLVIDGFLVWNTLKFGPGEWGSSPLVAQNIGNILAVSFTAIAGLEWALILTLGDSYQAGFWTGFGCQALLGCSSVVQLLSRNDTRGHSTTIWALRFVGSFGAGAMFRYRYECYPEDYWYAGTPLATALFMIAGVADVLYPFVYMKVERQAGESKKS